MSAIDRDEEVACIDTRYRENPHRLGEFMGSNLASRGSTSTRECHHAAINTRVMVEASQLDDAALGSSKIAPREAVTLDREQCEDAFRYILDLATQPLALLSPLERGSRLNV